jgi:hypothetical protein
MNVVNLGVSAGLEISVIVLTLLSLLGTAMLLRLAWAGISPRDVAGKFLMPQRVAQSHLPPLAVARVSQLARTCAASRAPPCQFPPVASASLRASRSRFE